jgi:two-component system cell cycle response regulator
MKILIAEDDLVSRRMLEANLQSWNYEVVVVVDGDEAWQALQGTEAPRLAILDWMMPGMDGVKVCEEVRKAKGNPYIYILMLTTKNAKEDVAKGLESGADDFLTKPYDALELRARLRAGRRILALQEGLLTARDALRAQITLDPLTSLMNRTAILAALKAELERSERACSSLAVFKTDLDHFSRINQMYGNIAGDAVLRETAQRISSVCRIYDSVARYGGEEFVIIAPGCDPAAAVQLGERIRASISDRPMDLSEGMVQLTLSVGVVNIAGERGISPESIISATEAGLARAKERGRNRVELAHIEEVLDMAWVKSQGQVSRLRSQDGSRPAIRRFHMPRA